MSIKRVSELKRLLVLIKKRPHWPRPRPKPPRYDDVFFEGLRKLEENQIDLDPKISKLIDNHFWELG